jgi:hypothetical protein
MSTNAYFEASSQSSSHQERGSSDVSARWSPTWRAHRQSWRSVDSSRPASTGAISLLEPARDDSVSVWVRLSLPSAFRAVCPCRKLLDALCASQFQWSAKCHFTQQQQPGRIARSSKAILSGLRDLSDTQEVKSSRHAETQTADLLGRSEQDTRRF